MIHQIAQLNKQTKENKTRKKIDQIFVNYFSQDNWKGLIMLTNDWKNNLILEKRYEIIEDCLTVLQLTREKSNPINVILPTVIAQIEGFLIDFCKNHKLDLSVKDNKKSRQECLLRKFTDEMIHYNFIDIMFNVLFQSSEPGEDLKFPFSRHKIMHGENIDYGHRDYLIRAFMILDCLVSFEYKKA